MFCQRNRKYDDESVKNVKPNEDLDPKIYRTVGPVENLPDWYDDISASLQHNPNPLKYHTIYICTVFNRINNSLFLRVPKNYAHQFMKAPKLSTCLPSENRQKYPDANNSQFTLYCKHIWYLNLFL